MADESKGNLEDNAAFMDLYSRQIGAFGIETMAKLVQVKALIVGVKGVGIEIAKNLTLAGPKAVTLFDNEVSKPKHQGSNFFVTDEDLEAGKTLAGASFSSLAELNGGVTVRVAEELNDEVVLAHDIVVFTEGTRKDLLHYNSLCRNNTKKVTRNGVEVTVPAPIAFISVVAMGPYGSMFSDFGPAFTIRDCNGEEPVTRIVHKIEDGVLHLLPSHENGKRADVADNDHEGWVTFSDVKGMLAEDGSSINDVERFRATAVYDEYVDKKGKTRKRLNPYALNIGDTSRFSAYEEGGYMTQAKVPVVKSYKSLSETVLNPGELGFTDGAKWARGPQLHLALQAVYSFQEETGSLPEPNNAEHADAVIAKAKQLNAAASLVNATSGTQVHTAVETVEEDLVRNVALFAAVELQPVATFFGGVVAQECVKLAGKFTPLDQWVHLDWFEVLPEERPTDVAPLNSRYDNQIAVFGKAFQDKLGAASTFLVGCGAIGCEMLKNFAMIGIGSNGGTVHCTDNDIIEISNLNRQFLFRSHNVGKQKSEASSAAAKAMNPGMNVKPYTKLVMPSTEDFFNDEFWESLTFVTNALDNIKARVYVDGRCVFYEKPLLESGTLGTKCNSQVIVPHLTQSYTDGPAEADEEDAIPMCTLRNFPSLIDHCIEWARAQFTDRFVQPATDAAKYCSDRDAWVKDVRREVEGATSKASAIASALPKVKAVQAFLDTAASATFENMVKFASDIFHECFRDKIQHLIDAYPEDHVKEDGSKFWSGSKRFPCAAVLDVNNETHLQYITSAANILACNFGVRAPPEVEPLPADHDWRSAEFIKSILAKTAVPVYVPTSRKIATEGEDADDAGAEEEKEFAAILEDLASRAAPAATFEPADFEKDHDFNFHIDFIHAASNLRAINYSIPEATRHKTKMIAGKIIPAIATATAACSGLVMLEMYKLVAGKDKLEDYRDSSNNLGVNQYLMMEPFAASKAKAEYSVIELCDVLPKPEGFTKWDKTVINKGELTLRQFLDAFKEQTELTITMLYHSCANSEDTPYSGSFLYYQYEEEKSADKMDVPLLEYIAEMYDGANVVQENRTYIPLEVSCEDDEGEAYKVPPLVYRFK